MKRTALKRKTPLRANHSTKQALRRSAISAFGSTTKHARRPRAPEGWFLWVKSQPCFVAWLRSKSLGLLPTPCCAVIDADHMGNRFTQGNGTRALDSTCVSICHDHHMERHGLTGAFKNFTGEDMQVFTATGVQWMQNRARAAGIEIPNC